jgi:hypothetical protein
MTMPVESAGALCKSGWRAAFGALVLLAACGGGMDADNDVEASADSPLVRSAHDVDQTPISPNLLLNASFDERGMLGALPTAPGNWRGDLAANVPTELGIVPHHGTTMLKFLATGTSPSAAGLTSKQWQVVDLSAYAAAIATGHVRAEASAWFNRIDAGARTDRRFDLRLMAFDAQAHDLPARYMASRWLAEATTPLVGAASQWQQLVASLVLPPATTLVLVELQASEDVFNDDGGPEFDGHYVDDTSLFLTGPR